METPKHTQGPWETFPNGGRHMIVREGGSSPCVATTPGWAKEHAEEERANAILIAAAPDMLAALQRIRDYADRQAREESDECMLWVQCRGFAREAIEKAEDGR